MMLRYITLFITVSILLTGKRISAQDFHFSQFETLSPLLNPAFTGTSHLRQDGTSNRLSAIYRNQWSSVVRGASYQTYGASFDMANCISTAYGAPTWGIGGGIIHDESGTFTPDPEGNRSSFPLQRDYLNLNGAFMVKLSDIYLSGGFRFRYVLSRLNTNQLRTDEQFDGVGGFDSSVAGEFDNVDQLNSNNFDLGTGLALFWLHNHTAFIGGGSLDYVYQPTDLQYLDSNTAVRRARRLTIHAKFTQVLGELGDTKIGFNLKSVFQNQDPFQQWIVRTDLFFDRGESGALIVGTGIRQVRSQTNGLKNDALLTSLGLAFKNLTLSFNYDINLSALNEVSNKYGALEFSVIYRWDKYKKDCFKAPTGCPYEDVKHAIFF